MTVTTSVYQCPGEDRPISRSVHLGRLARFHAACVDCPHRDDAELLPLHTVRQLSNRRTELSLESLWHTEGFGGGYPNGFQPGDVRTLASSLAIVLADECENEQPTVLLGFDGRALTSELLPSAAEGFRHAGCHTIDVGATHDGAFAWAVEHLHAAGGLLIGNLADQPHRVDVSLWGSEAQRLVRGEGLNAIRELFDQRPARPTRQAGPLERRHPWREYFDPLLPMFHGLRPLKLVLKTPCQPLVEAFQELSREAHCELIRTSGSQAALADAIRDNKAHLGLWIDGQGRNFQLFDEQGEDVSAIKLAVSGASQADALQFIAHLLVLLSQSDRSLSQVLED